MTEKVTAILEAVQYQKENGDIAIMVRCVDCKERVTDVIKHQCSVESKLANAVSKAWDAISKEN